MRKMSLLEWNKYLNNIVEVYFVFVRVLLVRRKNSLHSPFVSMERECASGKTKELSRKLRDSQD